MQHFSQINMRRFQVLDGGLATELEHRGVSVAGPLWSARALTEAPEAITGVHMDYLKAGAQVLLTAGYQVSARGFRDSGMTDAAAHAAESTALRTSVQLAVEALHRANRPDILVAASLGPYGAALANGAEFHGEYGFPDARQQHSALVQFHSKRIAALASTDADLLAFETLPSLAEAHAIVEALAAWPSIGAWLSFTCHDSAYTAHGEPLRDCAAFLDPIPQVLAIGVNCTPPSLILPLIHELHAATTKPIAVYPNSGETWNASSRCWSGTADVAHYSAMAAQWFAAGAQLVGGCCRTTPLHVKAVAEVARTVAREAQQAYG